MTDGSQGHAQGSQGHAQGSQGPGAGPPVSGWGLYWTLKELIGQEATDKLFQTYRSQRVYIIDLGRTTAALRARDDRIVAHRAKGVSWRTLQAVSGLSERHLRRIVSSRGEGRLKWEKGSRPLEFWENGA